MTIEDTAAVLPLLVELGYPVDARRFAARWETLDPEQHAIFVAEDDSGGIVAWMHVATREMLLSHGRAEIMGLIVHKTARRSGVGARLVEAAETWARDKGLDTLRVMSNLKREESHPFYLRRGFALKKTSAVYEKPVVKR